MTNTSARKFKVGLVQMCTGRDIEKNLVAASDLVRAAAKNGAHYVQTPEITTLMEMDRAKLFAAVRPEDGNPAIVHFRALARELKIWLHIGSMGVLLQPDKLANRSLLIAPDGTLAARFDKIHMFDVQLPGGESYRESKNYEPGATAVLAELPWGKLGMTVCYDLRFPQLYRALAQGGADILAIPSAFTVKTGEAHWHVLMRARHRERVLRSRRCAGRTTRKRALDLRPQYRDLPLGRHSGRGRWRSAWRYICRHRLCGRRGGARPRAVAHA